MTEIDARGLSCPLPVMRTRSALGTAPDTLVVLVDSGTAKANVTNMLSDEGYSVTVTEEPDHSRIEAHQS